MEIPARGWTLGELQQESQILGNPTAYNHEALESALTNVQKQVKNYLINNGAKINWIKKNKPINDFTPVQLKNFKSKKEFQNWYNGAE